MHSDALLAITALVVIAVFLVLIWAPDLVNLP